MSLSKTESDEMFQFSKVLFDSSSGLEEDKKENTLPAESQVHLINKTQPHEDGGQEVVRIDEGYVTLITVTVSVLGILVLATWTLMTGHGSTFVSLLLPTRHSQEEAEVAEDKTGEDEFIFMTKIMPQ